MTTIWMISNHPILARKAVIQALTYRANNVCFTPQILAKEMAYLHKVLLKNSYPDRIIKIPEQKQTTPDPDTGLEVNKNIFISVSYVPGLGEEFWRILSSY